MTNEEQKDLENMVPKRYKKSNHFGDWILLVGLGQRSSSLMNVVDVAGSCQIRSNI